MELQGKDKQELQQELSEFLQQYYDGSFSRMACDYIHATGDDGGRSGSFVGGDEEIRGKLHF